MSEILSRAEIETRFDNEWVLIDDPQTNDVLEVLGGKVLIHSKDRDEVYRLAVALRPKRCAVLYIGEMPGNTAIVV